MQWRKSAMEVYEVLRSRRDNGAWFSVQFIRKRTGFSQPTISTALTDLRIAGHVEAGMAPNGRPHRYRAASNKPLHRPGKDVCTRCGGSLGDRWAVCVECLPFNPAGSYEMSEQGDNIPQCIEMKVRLYTERYAAGLAMSPEPYTSPMPGRASEERSYDDSHLLRALRGR